MPAEAGRVAAITGASRGLGRALAVGLAARGWRVAGCGRDETRLAELGAELGEGHLVSRLDVASGDVEAWSLRVAERLGVPALLINNAGVINRPADLWRVPGDEVRQVLEVNVRGVYRVLRAFLPAMIELGRGVVVNLSSGWGRSTSPGVAPYCASKWAVEGMTAALAQELPAGLAAVALNPGIVRTDMLRRAFGDGAEAYPDPATWAERAVPFLLALGPGDNGGSLTVPG